MPAFRSLTSLLLLVCLTSVQAFAGELRGRIVDPDGRGVPNAEVLLTIAAAVHARAQTDSTGRFVLAAPDQGDVVLRVALTGFRAEPLPVTLNGGTRDLGTIPLAISAISDAVVVSAAQVEVPLSTTSSSVTVLTGDDLQRRQIESVADALRLVPGLTVAANGGRGAVTSVFPRGGESDYSLVLVDGIQANTFGGGFDFAHLPVANIDRIEIVRGAQSALYGSNAIGTVIRIITRRGGTASVSGSIEGGGYDTYRLAAATSGERGQWLWGGTAERLATDGRNGSVTERGETVVNDEYDRHSVSGALGWRREGASVRGDVRYANDNRGFPGPFGSDPGGTYPGIDAVSRGANDRWLMSAGGSVPLAGVRLNAEVTHARVDSEFVSPGFIDENPVRSDSWSRRSAARLQLDSSFGGGLDTSAGLELTGERAGGTFITATGNRPIPVERGLAGFFGEARWTDSDRIFVSAGLRVERITRRPLEADADAFVPRPPLDEDTVVSANPKLSAAWFARTSGGNFTKLRGAAGTGIRAPDAFEIAFTDNPSLKPERSRSVEAGLDLGLLDGLALLETTGFYNRYDDLIVATGTFTGSSQYRTDNISNARSRGIEIAATMRGAIGSHGTTVHLRIGYTFLDTEILAVDQGSDAPSPFTPGDELLRRPRHQFTADLRAEAGRLSAYVEGTGRSLVLDVDPSFGTFGGLYDLSGFTTWNAGASWRIRQRLEVFGRVLNVFDRQYEEALGFPAPGRSAIGGLRIAAGD